MRREGFRHFLRGGVPHALALASSAASAAALAAAAPKAWALHACFGSCSDEDDEEEVARLARWVVGSLALARCLDMVRLLAHVPLSSRIFDTIGKKTETPRDKQKEAGESWRVVLFRVPNTRLPVQVPDTRGFC